jgi:hypothetical protein
MPFRQQPQHDRVIRPLHQPQITCAQRGDRDRQRIVGVRLLRLRRRQHANPRRQRRRHVQHPLAGNDELLREEIAEPTGRLDRPHALFELDCPAEQLLELTRTRTNLNPAELLLAPVDRDRRVRSLVRIDTDHHTHLSSLAIAHDVRVRAGTPDSGGSCSRTSFEPHPNDPGGRETR